MPDHHRYHHHHRNHRSASPRAASTATPSHARRPRNRHAVVSGRTSTVRENDAPDFDTGAAHLDSWEGGAHGSAVAGNPTATSADTSSAPTVELAESFPVYPAIAAYNGNHTLDTAEGFPSTESSYLIPFEAGDDSGMLSNRASYPSRCAYQYDRPTTLRSSFEIEQSQTMASNNSQGATSPTSTYQAGMSLYSDPAVAGSQNVFAATVSYPSRQSYPARSDTEPDLLGDSSLAQGFGDRQYRTDQPVEYNPPFKSLSRSSSIRVSPGSYEDDQHAAEEARRQSPTDTILDNDDEHRSYPNPSSSNGSGSRLFEYHAILNFMQDHEPPWSSWEPRQRTNYDEHHSHRNGRYRPRR
ncbi:Uu.00g113900.m01.CDS01 [Anthostomella pinea]|uniref:Uu.00g113900.m01.CDS01 n=1 Tax=Anthostomella pinea TaxID=933095 RepID=A0AAI8VG30_9PEZI|nr:Uu.00g113900.m01.CDS01 [Anthostomella pinea]